MSTSRSLKLLNALSALYDSTEQHNPGHKAIPRGSHCENTCVRIDARFSQASVDPEVYFAVQIQSKRLHLACPIRPGVLFSCSRLHTAFGTVCQISSIPDDPQSRASVRSLSWALLFGPVRSLSESDTSGNWRGTIQMA